MILMKDFHLKILAIIMIIFGIFGLSTLPFLSIIVQYIDSITGFSSGNGYLTNNMDYLFKSPLIYIGGFFVFSIILAIIYLVYSFFKAKRGWLLMKKIISMVLSFILILGCSTTAFAAETHNYDTENLPHDWADYFETEIKADEENEERISDFVTVYGYQYTKGSLKSGAWRNGTSGGSSTSSAKLSLNYTQDTSYNISFKASVSGGYTNGGTIGSELGVTLGASKSYSLGSGYSVTVPKGSHYLIKYRPMYYTYKVVETKYKERYNEALGGMERYVVETKTCYVDVFSHWDFTHVAK